MAQLGACALGVSCSGLGTGVPEHPEAAAPQEPTAVVPIGTSGPPANSGLPEPSTDATRPVPPAEPVDYASEAKWARAKYPDALAKVSFVSLADKLEAWVPAKGQLTVYLSASDFACSKTFLQRPLEPEATGPGENDVVGNRDPAYLHVLVALTNVRESRVRNERIRSFGRASVGHFFETESASGWDRFEAGRWVPAGGSALGEPNKYRGTLSHVDSEVAIFGGVPARASVTCGGPSVVWQCPSGGTRSCDSCRVSQAEVVEAPPTRDSFAIQHFSATLAGACTDPCPKHVPPDKKRIEALFSATLPWMPMASGEAPLKMYKSRKRCLSEHKVAHAQP